MRAWWESKLHRSPLQYISTEVQDFEKTSPVRLLLIIWGYTENEQPPNTYIQSIVEVISFHTYKPTAPLLYQEFILCVVFFPVNVPIECWLWLYLEIDMPLIQNSDFFLCYNFLLWGFFDWTKNQNKTNIDTYIYLEKSTFFF